MGTEAAYDLITMGRSSIDLYSQDVGAPFEAISGFHAFVGGSPTNIATGAARLGLRVAALTAVGDDKVGDFVLAFLRDEGIDAAYVPRKEGHRTSAVLLGIEPPDRFPLVFYRENCADTRLDIGDVLRAPLDRTRAFEFGGTNLAVEPVRSATLLAAERARRAGATVYFDLDFRADQWHDPRAYGVSVRTALPLADVVIGTEEEINAAMLRDAADLVVEHGQVSAPTVRGDVEANVEALLAIPAGPEALVQKRGASGARVHLRSGERLDVPGFEVEVLNVLGAGDAFAAGLIFGRTRGWDWRRATRMGNACGAWIVTKTGCANFMAREEELAAFVASRGGL